MPTPPKIGIPVELDAKTGQLPESLADYQNAVIRAGGVPVLLRLTHDPSERLRLINSVDALLLRGGPDLDPKLYGQPLHPKAKLLTSDRQAFDLAMLSLAEQRRLPTLGICLGCQEMNVHRRGVLHQHLPDLPPQNATPQLTHANSNDRLAHDVTLRPGTKLAEILQLDHLAANSRHHQGIAKLGHGLVATATAPDGLVEAFEDPTLPFWLAVQWHPENLANSPHDRLFQALVAAAQHCQSQEPAPLSLQK